MAVRAYADTAIRGEADALVARHAELVKRIAFLKGLRDEPMSYESGKSDEEVLAEELAAQAAKKLAGA